MAAGLLANLRAGGEGMAFIYGHYYYCCCCFCIDDDDKDDDGVGDDDGDLF